MSNNTYARTGLTGVYNVTTQEAYVGAAHPSTAGTAHQAVVSAAIGTGLASPNDTFVGFAVPQGGGVSYNSTSLNVTSSVGDGTRDASHYAPVLHRDVKATYQFPDQDFKN